MLTRVLALFLSIILGALMLSVGIVAGIGMQADYEDRAYTASTVQSLRIAVVNQDMGVDYNGTRLHFASDIINTFGDDYVLVPKEAAESGVKNGNYAATISFPGDFSNQVVQINSIKPEVATFKYQLSSNLSQKDCIEILLKIIDLEKYINETLTYMYTVSAFGELHDAQAAVKDLMKNEDTGIQAVQSFVAAEMVPNLEISSMERDIPEVDYPDFREYMSENDFVLNRLLERYSEYMELANSDYSQIVSDAEKVIADTQRVSDAIDSIEMLPGSNSSGSGDYFNEVFTKEETDIRDRFSEFRSMLATAGTTLEDNNNASEITGTLDIPSLSEADISDLYFGEICDILILLLEAYGVSGLPATSGTTVSTPSTTLDIELSDAINELLVLCKALSQHQNERTEDYLDSFITDLTLVLSDGIRQEFKKLLLANDTLAETETLALTAAVDDMRRYIQSTQDNAKAKLTEAYTTSNQELSALHAQISGYNPTKYISDNEHEITGFNTQFRENNLDFDGQVNDAITSRSEIIFETYDKYEKYVGQLGEDMQSATEQSQGVLDSALEELLGAQLSKKDNNIALIGDFAEKLPNTKIGSQENNDFYSFFVSPVKISEVGYGTQSAFRPPVQKGVIDIADWMQVVIRLLAVLFVLTAGGYFVIKGVKGKIRENAERLD